MTFHITALNVCPWTHKTSLWCHQDYFRRLDWLLRSCRRHCATLIITSTPLKMTSALMIPLIHAYICIPVLFGTNMFKYRNVISIVVSTNLFSTYTLSKGCQKNICFIISIKDMARAHWQIHENHLSIIHLTGSTVAERPCVWAHSVVRL